MGDRTLARLGLAVMLAWAAPTGAAEDEVPEAFAPLEHLVGGWKGMAIPAANRLRGWPEKHAWAWKFAEGRPVGLAVEFEGSKALAGGLLRLGDDGKTFRFEATDRAARPVVFQGRFGPDGKVLTLDRVDAASDGARERLILRVLPENTIRYALWLDRRERGAPQFKRAVEVGLTREGEALAAAGASGDLPKCIVTGGAANMSVSFGGKSYPICCSGCRDEFDENPEKYVEKALARSKAGQEAPAPKPAPRRGDDDEFGGLLDEPAPKPKGNRRGGP